MDLNQELECYFENAKISWGLEGGGGPVRMGASGWM